MEQLKRVEKALTKLVLDQPFFATLALKLEMSETVDIPTFATDGIRLLINPKWCAELSIDEVGTVLAHEVLHCALGHMWRAPQGYEHTIWNIACDHEVNWELEEFNEKNTNRGRSLPFPWPKCGKVMDQRFRGQAAEKIYRTLMDEVSKSGGKKGQQSSGQGMGDVIVSSQNKKAEMKEQWERAVIQASAVAKGRGSVPGKIEELVKKLTNQKVDWRTVLRDCLSTIAHEDWTFRKANERYMDNDFVLPSLYNERVGKLVFAIDTSGSISSKMLAEFLSEAQFALDELLPESLTVIYCDTEIQDITVYEPGDIIKEKVLGRGGTDFCPVFRHCDKMDEPPMTVVYMTDLDGVFPPKAPDYRAIWITNNPRTVPFGEVIEVEL